MKKKYNTKTYGDLDPAFLVLMTNDHVNITHDCCKVCWDQKPETTIEGKLDYIERRVKTGHESIMEHSNIIMYIKLPYKHLEDVTKILPDCHYLNTKCVIDDNNMIHLLIGGSIRGYKAIFSNTIYPNNIVLGAIKTNLYTYGYKEYFTDFIQAGVMDENTFTWYEDPTDFEEYKTVDFIIYLNKVDIINIDDIQYLYDRLSKLTDVFTYDDLLDMCTVTILFKNMSRTATHQLVRHRNAITQESQRYVDYSGAMFSSPDEFKDIYDGKEYNINIFGTEQTMSMKDIGAEITKIYSQLRDQGVLKEDARAFLPSNIQCGKLYMTFTFRSLIKFLELRTDKAAQAEIRQYALEIEDAFKFHVEPIIGDIYKYLMPKFMLSENNYDYSNIDETLDEFEEVVDNE